MSAIIELTDIKKSFGSGESRVDILKGVSLTVEEGEFMAILGPSGSGKTTLMNILGLIDIADAGEYLLEGESVSQKSENEYATIRNQKIGFIFQRFNLIAKYSALYNVALPLLLRGEKREVAMQQAEEMLTRVGLGERLKYRPVQLSGGQQQRVAIARALVGEANIFLADEPTGALDSRTGQDVMNMLKELNQAGKTIIIITHDRGIADQTKRVIHVRDGLIYS
ncbi:putative ABC transport system ATP-binding protein [Aneurinibacillus soli]|uniref:Macrolide export ATP-binding/permease protein MacB n=1 Tax=Aneurinibacillus soli TaxID=1500254 RepID=A0A0U5BB01_9BACL|nr:ABC transporter ATP-binding protein [Aneurinibacillus soli]PYE61302.1 putative ABC transport system ATP-binding protein [Aneurinibacillus soli]BAU27869.1 Macrolide export ATP-binding/permease protein MacB [Aneurinibacillus soli]